MLVVIAVLQFRPAAGSPGDIFSIPAPEIAADPPKASDIKDGDATVATNTGAAQYGYPIQVPPGRNGVSPQLSLNYSSAAPTYGGLAANWSLSVPIITEDHSQGRLRTRSSMVEAQQVPEEAKADDRFVSSMAGGRPLVRVVEPTGIEGDVMMTYRAQNDTSFARYERLQPGSPFRWRVRTTDGTVWKFGESSLTSGCTVNDQYAPLTSQIDKFGNEIRYAYSAAIPGECRLASISWGRNDGAGLQDFAQVVFAYDLEHVCNGVYSNSQVDYRSGFRLVTGASRLKTITATAHPPGLPSAPVHTRRITLGYDDIAESCGQPHAPVRLLTSIQESAWITGQPAVNLPAVTFEYNSPRVTLLSPQTGGTSPWRQNEDGAPPSLGWGLRRTDDRSPTVESMWLDVDGDGLQDVVQNSLDAQSGLPFADCSATWYRNLGPDLNGTVRFSYGGDIALPRLKWRGSVNPHPPAGAAQADPSDPNREGCSLNGQTTAFMNSYPLKNSCHHEPSAACIAGSDPFDVAQYCRGRAGNPAYTRCPEDPGGTPSGAALFRTQLAYRWLDMDSDGLVDLVAAVHGDIDSYDIERGNDFDLDPPSYDYTLGEPSMSGIPGFNQWPSCSAAGSITPAQPCKKLGDCLDRNGARVCDSFGCTINWGVALSCLATAPTTGCAGVMAKKASGALGEPATGIGYRRHPYERCEGRYPWFIYRNLGQGQFASTPAVKYQPVPLESTSGDSALGAGGMSVRAENHAITDFDGDGWLDAVVRGTETMTGATCSTNHDCLTGETCNSATAMCERSCSIDADCAGGYRCDQSWSMCTRSTGSFDWQVWLGDGTGGFGPQMHLFPTRPMSPCPSGTGTCLFGGNAIGGIAGNWGQSTHSMAGLLDLNGDGAQDHWLANSSSANANIAFNYGDQIGLVAGLPPIGEVTTPAGTAGDWIKPGNDTRLCVPAGEPPVCTFVNPFQPITNGHTSAATRVADLDHDGRVDVVTIEGETAIPKVHFNLGGQFSGIGINYGAGGPGGTDFEGLRRRTEAVDYNTNSDDDQRWRLLSELVDLDGDGIAEGLYFSGGFRRARPQYSQPPRLLRAVHNGRGAQSTITYAQMHDTSTVIQNPDELWPDGRPKASPRAQWVVKSISAVDDLANTVSTTAYFYRNPRFGTDDEGHYAFRGFEQVTTTLPSGAQREETYSFVPDWSGRRAKVVMRPAEALGEARTIDMTTWEARTLFNDSIVTYHPTVEEHLTCFDGQTTIAGDPNQCTATSAAGYSRRTSTLTGIGSSQGGGVPVMYQETQSLLQAGTAAADGDRRTDTIWYLHDGLHGGEWTYRLVTTLVEKLHRTGGTFTLFERTSTEWGDGYTGDSSFRVPYLDEVWIDSNPSNVVRTRRAYDLMTGNVTMIWKPQQWAANDNPFTNLFRTTLAYDSRQLFVVTETNERGHVRDYAWEYGTGTKLSTLGPNAPTCAQTSSCPAGTPLKEEHRIVVDGLGRMLERHESFGDTGTSYQSHKVETNAYFDGPAALGNPATVTHQQAIDYNLQGSGQIRYAQDKTELDGHGRPLRKIISHHNTVPADQITSFRYANDGTLSEVRVPDPTLSNSALVSYTYTFDSLGRPTSIRRPDTTVLAQRSGVDITYDGLTQTSAEFVVAGDGNAARTRTVNDAFGRLVRVEELESTDPAETWAVTSYEYDPSDNVNRIVDPEGVTTELEHDFAGRRTKITRNTRVWTYGYDRNGNLTSEATPCSTPGCTLTTQYLSTTAYDELDRPSSKSIAQRGMAADDLDLFGALTEVFTWDTGPNGKGRMAQWQGFGSSGAAVTTVAPTHNVQGQLRSLTQTTNAAEYTNLSRDFLREYEISGAVRQVWYRDVIGGLTCPNGTSTVFTADARGLPWEAFIMNCPNITSPAVRIRHLRNVAGLVTRRYSVQGASGSPFTYVQSDWTYDKLGRVTSQLIKKGSQLEQVARQDLQYNGNDDPATMDHWLGPSNLKHFTFGYDHRHQLTSVGETPSNAFTATYSYGAAGRFASAIVAAAALPNGDVTARDVEYQYSTTDPERLLRLRKATGSKNLAEYTYDDAGNQLTRYYPATKDLWEYVYDGKNQLRRVTKKKNGAVQGSEEYWYDEKNARYLVVKRDAGGANAGAIWFIEDTEAHYDAAGTLTRVYGHVSMGTPVARTERTSDAASTLEYQFHGLANNTLATVDNSTGTTNASFVYAPFGEIIEATDGGAAANKGVQAHRRRMNDKFVDEVSGLAYYGYRYYDKLSMTWTQGDPLYRFAPDAAWAEPRRSALYTSHRNNPLRYVDPDGQDAEETLEDIAEIALTVGRFGFSFFNALEDGNRISRPPPPVASEPVGETFWAAGEAGLLGEDLSELSDPGEDGDHDMNTVPPGPDPFGGPPGPAIKINLLPKDQRTSRPRANERRAQEQARDKEKRHGDEGYEEPASEQRATWRAREAEKRGGKDSRRQGHDSKDAGEGDRTAKQLDEDYGHE